MKNMMMKRMKGRSASADIRLAGRSDERGLALLMALAVVSLLVLLGTAFTLTAIYSAEGARLAGEVIRTRLMMESATQDALSAISLSYNDPDDIDNMMPATKLGVENKFGLITQGTAWNGRYYWTSLNDDSAGLAEAFHHTVAGVSITPSSASTLLDDQAGWVHVQDGEEGGITARYAYLIIDESGQVDINASLDDSTAEGTEAETNSRIGKDANEISLVSVLGDGTFAPSLQRLGLGTGQLPAGLTWLSWHHLLSVNTLAPANSASINIPGIFPFSQEIEAFHDIGKDYHRYDLGRDDWDEVTVDDLTADATEYWGTSDSVNENEGGIACLSEGTTQSKQIAANIIDFCDADDEATSDSDGGTAPTYVGLEKVPYISEVSFNVALGSGTLGIQAWTELANIYTEAVGAGGEITLTFDVSSGDVNETGLEISWTGLSDVSAKSYHGTASATEVITLDSSPSSISQFKLTNITVKLTDEDDKLWDFATLPDMTGTTTINGASHQNAVEVDDPRHNTPASEWTWLGWGSAGSVGKKNLNSHAPEGSVDNDYEATDYMGTGGDSDVIELSTAFILNEPMESLWQLGCIHRGEAWQTLNIATYPTEDLPESKPSRTSLPAYEIGDGGILDQVKLNADIEGIGKININTYSQRTIRGLLANLRITGNHNDPTDSSVTAVTTGVADSVAGTPLSLEAGDWLYENGSEENTGTPFITRAELARIDALKNSTLGTQETDAAREEAIGKIASFCTTRSNYFTMIIIAQAIKDLKSEIRGGLNGEFDEGIDKVLAEQRIRMILRRDAYRNTFDVIRHDIFID